MTPLEAQALVEQAEKAIREAENIAPTAQLAQIYREGLTALDQLSTFLAEQEKAIWVKALGELLNEIRLKIAGLEQTERDTPITFGSDYFAAFHWQKCILEQKIEEAKK